METNFDKWRMCILHNGLRARIIWRSVYGELTRIQLNDTGEARFVNTEDIRVTWVRTIAVDFDGTLSDGTYPNVGYIVDKIKDRVLKEKEQGSIIILWTCREGEALEDAVKFCKENGVPIDFVNENPKFPLSRKVVADVYIDDKALNIKDVRE